jgi:cysteine-S-conjugate beta-lyase
MKFNTRIIHSGTKPDPINGALMPAIYMTSTFAQDQPGEHQGYDYTRAGNPNFDKLEEALASIEQSSHATVFSSGVGATTALLSILKPGDNVLAINGVYGGTFRLFTKHFSKFGVNFQFVSPQQAIELLSTQPKLIFLESPTNPLLDICDIQQLCQKARENNTLSVVDNTFATPYFQNPITLGADVVLHSTTKYIGGHSDVIGGALITNHSYLKEQFDFNRMTIGLNPSPFDSWLTLKGLKTLALRMQRHEENALSFVDSLKHNPYIKKIYYPGLFTHPNHIIAKKQMSGYSGIVSVEFNLNLETTKQLISSFEIFTLAESLGGIESLVCHPSTMTHASIPKEERERYGLNDGLIRFSIGIEDKNDLIQDIYQSIERVVSKVCS